VGESELAGRQSTGLDLLRRAVEEGLQAVRVEQRGGGHPKILP